MFALATVVEIDDRLSGRRRRTIVAGQRTAVIPELLARFDELERDPDRAAVGLRLQVYPDRTIRVVIFQPDDRRGPPP